MSKTTIRTELPILSAGSLRKELSLRGMRLAGRLPHEVSYSRVPNFIFQPHEGGHGNFYPASYRAILANPEWAQRLRKSYTGGQWIPRRRDRERSELECANSSDALLMNFFCCPGVLERPEVCGLLGIERGLQPKFGFKPCTAIAGRGVDRTEVDMSLGSLLVEAKLTESGFQSAPIERLMRYRDFGDLFDLDELPRKGDSMRSYQLIRGVLAAAHLDRGFVVLCDARRRDLIEAWFLILRAVRRWDLRQRMALLTWQELAAQMPSGLKSFLEVKYGIVP